MSIKLMSEKNQMNKLNYSEKSENWLISTQKIEAAD